VNGNRQRGERGAVGGQQVRADGGATHPGDHHLSHIFHIRQGVLHAELIGAGKLVRQIVDLTQHIEGVYLFKIVQIVQIHKSSRGKQMG
jgi:hypothetical protein